MIDDPAPRRSEAAEYAEFVRRLYTEDPEMVERCYELAYFGTPCWTGSPHQRVDHAIETDSHESPCHWMFLPDYTASHS